MRALPNMRVADPADAADLRAIKHAAAEVQGPVYFRIARLTMPPIFGPDHKFAWGKGVILREGHDVTLFGTNLTDKEYAITNTGINKRKRISINS